MLQTEAAHRLRSSMVEQMGGDVALASGIGTSIAEDEERRGKRHVACYQLGNHTLLPCDPDISDRLSELVSADAAMTDADFRSWAAGVGATVLGQSVMKVVGQGGLRLTEPGPNLQIMDWSKPEHLELMQAFVDAADADDLDEAEVEMDDLDALAVSVLRPDGSIGAYASSRPFEQDHVFGDIGIITASSGRRSGLGAAAVSGVISGLLLPGAIEPLYRCDPENIGSDRLSASLGFEPALTLTVVELPS